MAKIKEKTSVLEGVRHELKHVTWPAKQELVTSTVIAITVSAITAVMFWGIDSGLLAALKAAISTI